MCVPRRAVPIAALLSILLLSVTGQGLKAAPIQAPQAHPHQQTPQRQQAHELRGQAQATIAPTVVEPIVVDPIAVDPVPVPVVDPVAAADSVLDPTNDHNLKASAEVVGESVPDGTGRDNAAGTEVKGEQKEQAGIGAQDQIVIEKAEQVQPVPQLKLQQPSPAPTPTPTPTTTATTTTTPTTTTDAGTEVPIQRTARVVANENAERHGGNQIHYQSDRALTLSEQTRYQQHSQSTLASHTWRWPLKTILFECSSSQPQQLVIQPSTNMQILVQLQVYILNNNAYSYVQDVESAGKLKVYIYENDSRIVGQGQLYYQKSIVFDARADSHYLVRVYNQGMHKLVSFSYPALMEDTHLNGVLGGDRGNAHFEEIGMLGMRIEEVTARLRRNSLMDRVNNEVMIKSMSSYSGYQFVQMLALLAVTAFQVKMVKNLFHTDSIL